MQLTSEVLVLNAPVDSLAIGPWLAFGQGDLRSLQDGDEVRSRLLRARSDPGAMPRVRRAYERWRLGTALELDDEGLIDLVGAGIRRAQLAAVLLRNAEADLRPGAEVGSVGQSLSAQAEAGTQVGALGLEVRLAEMLRRAAVLADRTDPLGGWDRLVSPSNLARNVAVLRAWTRTFSRGPAAVAEAFHSAKGAYVASRPLFEAAAAVYVILGRIGDARTEKHLDDAAQDWARSTVSLGVEGLSDILHLASTRGTEGFTSTAQRDRSASSRASAG